MKFFADNCFFQCGIDLLKKSGYDIIKARAVALHNASDEEIVHYCNKNSRIILTLDTDFCSLYRFPLGTHKGIIFFRITPFMPHALLSIMKILIEKDMFAVFENALVIARRDRIKIIKAG